MHNQFLDFILHELMPTVEKEWPINKKKQAVVGHSLGGLFTLYALCARPHLFSHIVAGSPSVWWADN
ncbi:alpha/beta hydrolase-fold protein, partial [Lysinibacillus sp. D4B1_S16]|uniref:alpha/beta hydrolase-fold protein n=1 Tax=Lysinibacillus sp. D4B1_S16 TaxID=2941231 RepID=UPI00289E0267